MDPRGLCPDSAFICLFVFHLLIYLVMGLVWI